MLVHRIPSHDLRYFHDSSGFFFISFSQHFDISMEFLFSGGFRFVQSQGKTATQPVQVVPQHERSGKTIMR
jgi:hypothetical protein